MKTGFYFKARQRFTALMLCLLVGAVSAFAQQITVSGKIIDGNLNEPLIGVSVLEKGTTNGVVTDLDGNYSLQVNAGATIVYSYIGYVTVEKAATAGQMDITMQEDNQTLEEVVVVGYGVQKRSSVTGSISSVKSEDFQNRTITNAEQALQGKTAGVQIISSSAAPGSSASIRIRGYSSNGSSDPLYVVDGLRTKDISNIDPNDIESMEVLKDAASAAIYGAQAGNGVILITTRKAKKGVRRITYDVQLVSQHLGRTPEVMNAKQYIDYMTTDGLIAQNTIDKYWDGVTDTDWIAETFEGGFMQRHNINFQGANENGSLFASLSYLNNNGPIIGDKDHFDRISGTINADYKIKDWLKFTSNNTFSRYHVQTVSEGSFMGSMMLSALQLDPLTPVVYAPDALPDKMINYRDQGHTLIQDENGNYYSISPYGDTNNNNPYIMRDRGISKREGFVFSGSSYLDFTPIKQLVVTSRLGYRFASTSTYGYTFPNITCSDLYQDFVTVDASSGNTTYWQWENFANYTQTFKEKHNFNAMIGMSFSSETAFDVTGNIRGSRVGDVVDLGITKLDPNYAYFNFQTGTATRTLSGGEKRRYANLSYFGRVSYDFENKYFAQFTFRADAADLSILPMQKRWGYFPAVSVGWQISNENFMKNVEPITHLKLRASWGQNGSIAGLSDYMYDTAILSTIIYPMGNEPSYSVGSKPSSIGNNELKWETSEQLNIGIDLRMFRDRLSFSADYFNKKTKDLIVTGIKTSLMAGNSASPLNAGDVSNKGFEFELGWQDNIKDFSYSVKANIATLKNEVTYLHPTLDRLPASISAGAGTMNYFEEGYPVWYIRGYEVTGIDPETGEPIFVDKDNSGTLGEEDKTMIGSAIPDFTYGITLNAAWKGFDLTVFGAGSQGNDVFMAWNRDTRRQVNTLTEFYEGRWTQAGDHAKYARANLTANNVQYLQSSKFVFDGSYFKIKQIQLGYTLPQTLLRKANLSNMRVYCSLEDFFTFTKYPGFDPEFTATGSGMGLDMGSYPGSKKVVFGLNVSF